MSFLLMRRTLLCAGLALGVGGFVVQHAKAQLHGSIEPLFDWAQGVGDGHRLVVNGLTFEVDSGLSGRTPSALLDVLSERCDAQDGGLGARARQASGVDVGAPTRFRLSSDEAGMVACLQLGRDALELSELVERLQRAAKRGDLAEVGDVWIARVTPAKSGSHWVQVRSSGPLLVERAFPASGDVPGADVEGLPRPPGSRRVLSAGASVGDANLLAYDLPSERSLDTWLDGLRAVGWQLDALFSDPDDRGAVWLATRGRQGVLIARQAEADGRTTVSLAQNFLGD